MLELYRWMKHATYVYKQYWLKTNHFIQITFLRDLETLNICFNRLEQIVHAYIYSLLFFCYSWFNSQSYRFVYTIQKL